MEYNPPFAIGQKVVCIEESMNVPYLKKGKDYDILDIDYFPYCNDKWGVIVNDGVQNWWYNSSNFRPIQPIYANISKEIAESMKETIEAPDKIIVPEKVKV